MAKQLARRETVHIDETTRTAWYTVQWLAENLAVAGSHPITHNNELEFLIGGQEGFGDIAKQIALAEGSIDLCCWGFDAGMELVRAGKTWPRGETFGDLLLAASRRGVKVRLLVWYDALAVASVKNPRNIPGLTHDYETSAYYDLDREEKAREFSVRTCLDWHTRQYDTGQNKTASRADLPLKARKEYCALWCKAAFAGHFPGIEVRVREGKAQSAKAALARQIQMHDLVEGQVLAHFSSHHQKPILIDFLHEGGRKAVGYVMGLNALTDYWDTCAHRVDDYTREQGGEHEEHECVQQGDGVEGFKHLKPLRDYACRIKGGRSLSALYDNFYSAWDQAKVLRPRMYQTPRKEWQPKLMPAALTRKAGPRDSSVQIVRTQPDDEDTSIQDTYFQATDTAAHFANYLYLENQYFQFEEWSGRLMAARKRYVQAWDQARHTVGKSLREMPTLYVFLVIPAPENKDMIPRTYDTLAHLGEQEHMTGQAKMIKDLKEPTRRNRAGQAMPQTLPEVVKHAEMIAKPTKLELQSIYNMQVCTVMLSTCDVSRGRWRYREIYIHSKLLLIDDTFITLGSANLNQRSMAVDSELNLATIDPDHAAKLRERIWTQLSGGEVTASSNSESAIALDFKTWSRIGLENRKKQIARSNDGVEKQLTGFIVALADGRSSTSRIG